MNQVFFSNQLRPDQDIVSTTEAGVCWELSTSRMNAQAYAIAQGSASNYVFLLKSESQMLEPIIIDTRRDPGRTTFASESGHASILSTPSRPILRTKKPANEHTKADNAKPRMSFIDFLLSGPKWPDDMIDAVNERSRDTGREIEL